MLRGLGRSSRVPVMHQTSMSECGAACLAMMLSAHGWHTTVAECRESLEVGRDGASLLQIAEVARARGMVVRGLRVGMADLDGVQLPAIAHWKSSHYVIVERIAPGSVQVVDPQEGRRQLTREEFELGFSGVLMEMVPGEGFATRAPDRRRRAFALELLSRLRGPVLTAVGVSVALYALLLVTAVLLMRALDGVARGWVPTPALTVVVPLATVAAFATLVYVRFRVLVAFQSRLTGEATERILDRLLTLPLRYFQTHSTNDVLVRTSSCVSLRAVLIPRVLTAVIDGVSATVAALVLLFVVPAYGALIALVGLLQAGTVTLGSSRTREPAQRGLAAHGELQSELADAVEGIETLKTMGGERRTREKWATLLTAHTETLAGHQRAEAGYDALFIAVRIGAFAGLVVLSAWLVATGGQTWGAAVVLGGGAGLLVNAMGRLCSSARQLGTVGYHLERLRELVDERPEQEGTLPVPPTTNDPASVELRGASFRYSANSALSVDGVDLTLPAGATVAIVGASGSGKTTLARLIFGLHRPTDGDVLVDGRPLWDQDVSAVRQGFASVPQHPTIFAASVRANIEFGAPGASPESVELAARQARIHDEIAAMPMGYETHLPPGGGTLSGGQRQRLALARAFLRNPRLLLLDEATSHLDRETERRIEQHLNSLSCTRLVIAHRQDSVRDAALIVVLDRGKVAEVGSHDELMRLRGHYFALFENQPHGGATSLLETARSR